jgi:hypothetical protein
MGRSQGTWTFFKWSERHAIRTEGRLERAARRSDNRAFLQALYQDVLHRAIDPSGLAAWTNALIHLERTTVVALILASPEAEQDLVQSAYRTYLHR